MKTAIILFILSLLASPQKTPVSLGYAVGMTKAQVDSNTAARGFSETQNKDSDLFWVIRAESVIYTLPIDSIALSYYPDTVTHIHAIGRYGTAKEASATARKLVEALKRDYGSPDYYEGVAVSNIKKARYRDRRQWPVALWDSEAKPSLYIYVSIQYDAGKYYVFMVMSA